jgi:hypothetical protein
VTTDMDAVRIGPDLHMAVVDALSYFLTQEKPRTPQDLTSHNCINLGFCPHIAVFTPRNSRRMGARLTCGSKVSSSSTVPARWSTRP